MAIPRCQRRMVRDRRTRQEFVAVVPRSPALHSQDNGIEGADANEKLKIVRFATMFQSTTIHRLQPFPNKSRPSDSGKTGDS